MAGCFIHLQGRLQNERRAATLTAARGLIYINKYEIVKHELTNTPHTQQAVVARQLGKSNGSNLKTKFARIYNI